MAEIPTVAPMADEPIEHSVKQENKEESEGHPYVVLSNPEIRPIVKNDVVAGYSVIDRESGAPFVIEAFYPDLSKTNLMEAQNLEAYRALSPQINFITKFGSPVLFHVNIKHTGKINQAVFLPEEPWPLTKEEMADAREVIRNATVSVAERIDQPAAYHITGEHPITGLEISRSVEQFVDNYGKPISHEEVSRLATGKNQQIILLVEDPQDKNNLCGHFVLKLNPGSR